MLFVDITRNEIQQALRSFLTLIMDPAVEVFIAQDNRVPEPHVPDFIVMTWLHRQRIATNIDSSADVRFTGSVALTVLTVTAVSFGSILNNATLFGVDVLDNTIILAQLTGTPGGIGTYKISKRQTISSRILAAGQMDLNQHTSLIFQLDVHGPNSGDNAQIISTAFRDEYAIEQFQHQGLSVVPIYADDPKQVPFQNAEQQWESRWVIEAHMQANITVKVPQQYADEVVINIIDVDAAYPPTPREEMITIGGDIMVTVGGDAMVTVRNT